MADLDHSNLEKQIDELIDRYSEELTEEQVKVLPLLCFGMSTNRIEKLTKVSKSSIRQWSRTDPAFRSAIREFRQYSNLYHVMMLNQAAVVAWDRVFELLETDYDIDDKSNRSNQARIAQFILSELNIGSQLYKKEEVEEKPHLNISEDSADIIARKVHELQVQENKTVDAKEYQVEDAGILQEDDPRLKYVGKEFVTNNVDPERPEFDMEKKEFDLAAKHPSTEYGVVSFDKSGRTKCHICGEKVSDLVVHIRSSHNMSAKRYRVMFGIPKEVILARTDDVVPADEIDIEKQHKMVEHVEKYSTQSTDGDKADGEESGEDGDSDD